MKKNRIYIEPDFPEQIHDERLAFALMVILGIAALLIITFEVTGLTDTVIVKVANLLHGFIYE